MKLEKVLILGGGPLQRDLIEAAKKFFYVIVLDGNLNCASKTISDEFQCDNFIFCSLFT